MHRDAGPAQLRGGPAWRPACGRRSFLCAEGDAGKMAPGTRRCVCGLFSSAHFRAGAARPSTGVSFVRISFSRFLSLAFVVLEEIGVPPQGPSSLPCPHTTGGLAVPLSLPLSRPVRLLHTLTRMARLRALSHLHDATHPSGASSDPVSPTGTSQSVARSFPLENCFSPLSLASHLLRRPVLSACASTTGCCNPRKQGLYFPKSSLSPH